MNFQIKAFLLENFSMFSLNFDFATDWTEKFTKKIKLPSLQTDANLTSLGFNNIMFAYVFLQKLMMMFLTAAGLACALLVFKLLTLCL